MKLLCVLVLAATAAASPADYAAARQQLVEREAALASGAGLVLSPAELAVNDGLMAAKRRELQAGLRDVRAFPPANHFFQAKEEIEKSKVFAFIKAMPKGAMLHGHDVGMVSTDYVIGELTYRDHLHSCVDAEGKLRLRFMARPDASCNWTELAEQRRLQGAASVDAFLRRRLSLVVDNPQEEYPDINTVWKKFSEIFSTIFEMVTYRPVFEEYYHQTLEELWEDGLLYSELRGILPAAYELDGSTLSEAEVLELYKNVTLRFREEHPGFFGARFIYAPSRRASDSAADRYVELALQLRAAHPDFFLGFDLVGQEDLGRPLRDFSRQLLELAPHMPFFFHAGETNWQGLTDENLVDAVLLNATRIGHGFALPKHPELMRLVRERNIAIEVNPISNQVLKLVDDLRNHPCAMMLAAENSTVVIAPDDPSFWGAKGVSYDLYLAFMGMAPAQADLRLLKQLALNSIRYSGLGDGDKQSLEASWRERWERFIAGMAANSTELSVEQLRG
ncbi:adenosine deaminase 2-like [Bacillus rossius redtenbacheri]|uniref:adenosine deaminase 2-like n=1 Tax=Bacillus rossius redtenbacheri TaxID=93214 RepID=UPI002FDD2FDE